MSDAFKVQVNLKVGETLINVRGDSVAEVMAQVEQIKENLNAIGDVMTVAKQVQMAKGLTGFTPPPASTTNAPTAKAAPGALECVHGPYKDLKGKRNAKGQLYKNRYFCPSHDRNNQCKADDLPGQEKQSD